jgi:tetratricopeptide (TPR) repeat protein
MRDGKQPVETLPETIDSVRSRACILEERKDYDGAARVWQEFVRRHPDDHEAVNELGIALVCAGRFEQSLEAFRQALRLKPDFISAKTNAGVALRHLDRVHAALSQFQEVVEATPDDAIACFNLATTLHLARQYDDALIWLQKALVLNPSHAESALELGKVLAKLDRNEEAIQAYRRALALTPDCIAALLNLAALLQKTEKFDQATTLLQQVVALRPNGCDGWLRLGAALRGAGRRDESLAAFRRALSIQPGSAVGYCALSLTLFDLGRFEEAIEASKRALVIEPGSPVVTFNMGTMLLSGGNFRDGWPAYNYRYAATGEKWLREEAHAPPWAGEALAGKSILILGEQGNGDQIQFVRYLPALRDLGASVFYLAPERLHRLFKSLNGSALLLSEIQQNSRFDFQCPLMHLPGVFETLGLPIQNEVPYLAAEPERIAHWRSRIGDHGFRIGIAWQGNQYDSYDLRSYPLAALRPLAAIPGIRLISLQLNDGSEQFENLPPDMSVERLGPDFDVGEHGFIDAAAVIEVVDLVVSCDTSIVHLAGALGRPVWIALSEVPEWRWQQERSDSIWYPSATLFRQNARGDWDGVFSRMADALAELLEARTTAVVTNVENTQKAPPRVEVSWGELLDKISILKIKQERITSPAAAANVRRELAHLSGVVSSRPPLPLDVEERCSRLRSINEELWDVEDALRACEKDQRFDYRFVELARTVYTLNDQRAKTKREINALMKSDFVEEKEYSSGISSSAHPLAQRSEQSAPSEELRNANEGAYPTVSEARSRAICGDPSD